MKKLLNLSMLGLLCLWVLSASSSGRYNPWLNTGMDADSSHNWDALHYDLLLRVTPISVPDNLYLQGRVTVRLTPEVSALDTVDLHFVGLEVDSAYVGVTPCVFTRIDCLLYIALPQPVSPSDSVNLTIFYHGYPEHTVSPPYINVGISYSGATPGVIYTMADPRGLRNWMPCWDEPWDKATIRQRLEFPSAYTVVANGTFEDSVSVGGGYRRWSYFMDQPVTSYLVSFCAAQYATFEQTAGPVQIKHYVYPQHLTQAQNAFALVPQMIQTYSTLFGPYPYSTFGYAEAPIFGGAGAMENQTMVTWGLGFTNVEGFVAHELAHQWFGDGVTYLDWPDMWLSEGFAEYAEPLWYESLYGFAANMQVLIGHQSSARGWANAHPTVALYDPPWNLVWDQGLVYFKGAAVLHLLRHEVGDSATFFEILQEYFSTYCYGNATTWDLEQVVEDVTGDDYDWFFNQWVFQPGYPTFEYFTTTQPQGSQTLLSLAIAQTQGYNWQDFRTTANLYIFTDGDTTIERITIEALPAQQIDLLLAEAPDSVQLDPLSWILCSKQRLEGITGPLLSLSDPVIADAGGDGFLNPGESGELRFTLLNSGSNSSNLTVEVSTTDPGIALSNNPQTAPELAFYGTYNFTANPFTVQNAPDSPPRWVHFEVEVTETGSGNPVACLGFDLPVGTPEILLVDDDGGGNSQERHQQALDSLERVYRTVTYETAAQLPPLEDYLTVIWSCGAQQTNTLTAEDQTLLQTYLQNGGSFFLSGRDVAPDLSATTFFQNILHASYGGTTFGALINGVDPLVAGLTFFNQNEFTTTDVVAPQSGSAATLLEYSGAQLSAAVKYDGSYMTCLLGFAFEDIADNPNYSSPEALLEPLLNWMTGTTGVASGEKAIAPRTFGLGQNYPNPFNAATAISYQLTTYSFVSLRVYDTAGRLVDTLVNGWREAGSHKVSFNPTGAGGSGLASGVYLYRLEAGEKVATGKMVLLK